MKIQELKIKEYRHKCYCQETMSDYYLHYLLSEFYLTVCDDMPLLPDGEMPPLNYSSESVFMYALIAMPTLYEFN